MRFRSRLNVSYSLVLAGLLAVASTLLIYTMRNLAERRLDATLWVLGTSEAQSMVARLRDRNLKNPDDLSVFDVDYPEFSGYEEFRTQKYVTVVDTEGHVTDFSLNLPNRPMPINYTLVNFALEGKVNYETADIPEIGMIRIIYVPVLPRWTERFVVMVGIPTTPIGTEVGTLARRVAISSFFVLVLAAASGWFLARRSVRPIVDTAVTLQDISDRNLHKRLPDSGVDDEINHLVKVINELLARLEVAFDTQRRFTADASHEICTPLTVLKGTTQVALMARRTPEEYMATLRSNLEEINRLTTLAMDLLTLARFDAGEQYNSKEPLVLNDLVENVCTRLRPVAAESGVRLACRSLEPVVVNGEANALQQIVLNLCTNAVRYTPGGGSVAITAGRTPEGLAYVEVADTGIGIPTEALPRIFDRFYRGENARAHSPVGSGLGLAICQVLAKAHSGHIEVSSECGKGSRFKLLLPVSARDKDLIEAPELRYS